LSSDTSLMATTLVCRVKVRSVLGRNIHDKLGKQ